MSAWGSTPEPRLTAPGEPGRTLADELAETTAALESTARRLEELHRSREARGKRLGAEARERLPQLAMWAAVYTDTLAQPWEAVELESGGRSHVS